MRSHHCHGGQYLRPCAPGLLLLLEIHIDADILCAGPGLTYQHLHADPAQDYPEMAETPGIQEDYASYLHCLMHLTQMLTNAHDLLYPSKSRSIALAKAEHYYKHIDDFTESQCEEIHVQYTAF